MFSFNLKAAKDLPQVLYLGDGDTGLVHRAGCGCAIGVCESFLDVRTALIRGYTPCPACTLAPSITSNAQHAVSFPQRAPR